MGVLVEWEGMPADDATWENLEELKDRFPDFILEDKEVAEEGRDDENESRNLKNAYNRVRRAKLKHAGPEVSGPNM